MEDDRESGIFRSCLVYVAYRQRMRLRVIKRPYGNAKWGATRGSNGRNEVHASIVQSGRVGKTASRGQTRHTNAARCPSRGNPAVAHARRTDDPTDSDR